MCKLPCQLILWILLEGIIFPKHSLFKQLNWPESGWFRLKGKKNPVTNLTGLNILKDSNLSSLRIWLFVHRFRCGK